MTDNQEIAVTGATGQQGGATARSLLDRGAAVRALVRDADGVRARELRERGARLVEVDLTEPGSVAAALDGARAAFVMATMLGRGGLDEEITIGRTVLDAAADRGIEHVVYSSVGGAERQTGVPHFESKRRIEEHAESLPLRATFLRPVFFMDNFLVARPTVEDGEIVVRLPLPATTPLQMVAVDDIGRVAAALLADGHDVKAIEIVGDELTGDDVAAAYAARFGRPARYEALPLDVLADDPDQQSMFAWFAGPVAYQGDFAATRALDPEVLDFRGWLARPEAEPATG